MSLHRVILLPLALAALAGLTPAQEHPKSDLAVLLVAQDPEHPVVPIYTEVTDRALELCRERTAAFEGLLREHFNDVTVVYGADYLVGLSEAADVTLFDVLPPVLGRGEGDRDPVAYLPQDFAHAALTISHVSPLIGESLGTKNDWL